ncbi:MAG: hypothetical protein AB7P00_36925 [Sandaracinaceae bacterium]
MRRPPSFPAILVLTSSLLSGACGPEGPIACTGDADCAATPDTPYCLPRRNVCAAPCVADDPGTFACVDGRYVECGSDMAIPCTVCPSVCGAGMFCSSSTMSCSPPREAGMACMNDSQCVSSSCVNGICGVGYGEPCTPATCDGVCAAGGTPGDSLCLRTCDGFDRCSTNGARGLEWFCLAQSATEGLCLPKEDCDRGLMDYINGCATLSPGRCGDACPNDASEPCFTFCAPPEVYQ